ncbi:hypothetical protein [Actinomadura sp. WMMA1423]|uniref:hypothetical protein n=1 Tax=Actinomadura sp. WMMA1423 TaxID=2591108 RepID=UPI00114638A1|nr:hypothetical protein [Actinomadura sp. WMMA1423]
MSTPTAIADIHEGVRVLVGAESPIPPGDIRDHLAALLDGITAGHRLIPETDETVALCTCGDEWECGDVEHASKLARALISARDNERTRVGKNWRV